MCVTREEYPRIRLALQKGNDDNEYIGPFISSMVVKQTVEEANRAFLLPTCRALLHPLPAHGIMVTLHKT